MVPQRLPLNRDGADGVVDKQRKVVAARTTHVGENATAASDDIMDDTLHHSTGMGTLDTLLPKVMGTTFSQVPSPSHITDVVPTAS